MSKPTLNFLGSDFGFGKSNNSAYVEINQDLIIIDCGFTVFHQLKDKFDFHEYNNIFFIITHLHNDHAGSLSQMILYLWFCYGKKVNVISKCNQIRQYLEITGTERKGYEIKDCLENFEFIKTEHVKHLDSYGWKANWKGKTIVYTGDTNTLEPFKKYISQADELYVDVSKSSDVHLKIDDVLQDLKKASEKRNKCVFNAYR